jgi:hypothetical protein
MSIRNIGFGLIILGLLVIAVSFSADLFGLGSSPGDIGWRQFLGIGIGLIIAVAGVILSILQKKSKA